MRPPSYGGLVSIWDKYRYLATWCLMILLVLVGCSDVVTQKQEQNPGYASAPVTTDTVIARENALPGTTSWRIPSGQGATTQLQAYASATSVSPGGSIAFMLSTQVEGMRYSLGVYRLGWYGGSGGRLKFLLSNQLGHAQGYYDAQNHKLINCSSCRSYAIGLIEANWQPSYTLSIPRDWVTGVYLAKFADANGFQTYVPFDLRGGEHSTYVLVTSDTTYQAYNDWGGLSLYESETTASSEESQFLRSSKVSFDRPYRDGYGSGQVLLFESAGIRWLERQGYDVSYMSGIDMHEHPSTLLTHRVYLSIGHDEYWTKEMRDGVEYARDHGVSLGFFGANEVYWQMRFEPDMAGNSNRTVVCYKVESGNNDLARDPLYGRDNSRVTSQWRDPVINRPENALVGIMFSHLTHQQQGFPWQVASNTSSSLFQGTHLQAGSMHGCGLVGYEWDRVFQNGFTPPGLHILAQSRTIDDGKNVDFSNTTYYVATSGAIVFAAGSIYWTQALDSYRLYVDPHCVDQPLTDSDMQHFMANVMKALTTHHI